MIELHIFFQSLSGDRLSFFDTICEKGIASLKHEKIKGYYAETVFQFFYIKSLNILGTLVILCHLL